MNIVIIFLSSPISWLSLKDYFIEFPNTEAKLVEGKMG